MKMSLLLFFSGLISLAVSGQSNHDRSQKPKDTEDVQTVSPEDALRYRYYDNGTSLNYDIVNDSNNIYLVFKIWDAMTQRRIMRAGLKISLETRVNSPRTVTIEYPLGNHYSDNNSFQKQNQKLDKQELRSQFLLQNSQFKASGFVYSNGFFITSAEKGLNATIRWDNSNDMLYTVRIPLKELFGYPYDINLINKKDIKLEVEEKAFPKPEGNRGSSSMRENSEAGGEVGMSSGGMGGHRGGGMMPGGEGGYGQSQGQDREQLFHPKSFSKKFRLSELP